MTITISRKLTQGKELVIIPKEEYEALIELKKVYEFQSTLNQERILLRARKRRTAGKALTLGQFKQELGLTN